jgi:SAM-dependent methyltransferase
MRVDDRFDDLVTSLGGFYRTWYVYVGLELGLFGRLRDAGSNGLTADELAQRTGTEPRLVHDWSWGADAHDLVAIDAGRITIPEDIAVVLLDADRSEYLGGQFLHAAIGSLDYGHLLEVFRSGTPVEGRPDRYRAAIERLTVQDIAVFFQEGLAALPDLASRLARGGRILDVACGGGKWLIAVAARFPNTELVGVEFEPDSVARAVRHVTEAGLEDRIRIEARDIPSMPFAAEFDLVYMQDALHEMPDPTASLRAAWAAVMPGGRLVILEWCLPASLEESQTLQAELLWGIQIDELFQGTRMYTRQGFDELFAAADVPAPAIVDLLSGASLFVVERPT